MKLSTSDACTEVGKASKSKKKNFLKNFKHFPFKRTYFQIHTTSRKKVYIIFAKNPQLFTL